METLVVFLPIVLLFAAIFGAMFIHNIIVSLRNNVAKDEGVAVFDPQKDYVYGTCPTCGTKILKDHVRYELQPKISDSKKQRPTPQCLFSCPCGRSMMIDVPLKQVSELRYVLDLRKLQMLQARRAGSSSN